MIRQQPDEATSQEPTMESLEYECFPHGCVLPKDMQQALSISSFADKLNEIMTLQERIQGITLHDKEKLKEIISVVCRGCSHHECEHNLTPKPRSSEDKLDSLMFGLLQERRKKGDKVLTEVFSDELMEELKNAGVDFGAVSYPSLKNPRLWIYFSFRGKEYPRFGYEADIHCEIGTRRLQVDKKETKLDSFEQFKETVHQLAGKLIKERKA